MKIGLKLASVIFLLVFTACKNKQEKHEVTISEIKTNSAYQIPNSWIQKRVSAASDRLNKNEAGKVLWNAMEAHGGLKNWYANGYLSFAFDYQPLDGSTRRNSYQTIDTWNNKALHNSITDTTSFFGWDGNEAWVKAKDSTSFAYDTKFWALTPLYFTGQPFVFDGKGVELELLPQKELDGKLQDVVKVTYSEGTGSAPDDYYILYVNTENHKVDAFRYIVSYPEYFPNGGHAPEKITVITNYKKVEGMFFAEGFKTYWSINDGEKGEYITKIDVSDIGFEKEVPANYFSKPEGGKVIE